MIVMLTATPNAITRKFGAMGVPYACLDYYGKVHEDDTRQRIYYNSFTDVISSINGKTLIYVPTIDLMKEYGVKRVFCGHIHGKYNIPRTQVVDGLEITLISSDFSDFIPYIIK